MGRCAPYHRSREGEAHRWWWRASTLHGARTSAVRQFRAAGGRAAVSRTTATILITDLVGSTELRGRLGEEAADELRRKHDQLLTRAVDAATDRSSRVSVAGSAAFSGASHAVAAVAIGQAVDRLSRSGKEPGPLSVRVGLPAGDVALESDDVALLPAAYRRGTGFRPASRLLTERILHWNEW